MKIAIASDHAGFAYKEQIKTLLTRLGHEVRDFGTNSNAAVDYPAFIRPAAEAVQRGECERGIVLGGSGNGEAIVANKVRGVRCALCWSLEPPAGHANTMTRTCWPSASAPFRRNSHWNSYACG